MTDVEEVYKNFWRGIVEDEAGELDKDSVMRELYDFYQIMDRVPKVYDYVTGGAVSNIMVDVSVVCSLADEHYEEIHSEEV